MKVFLELIAGLCFFCASSHAQSVINVVPGQGASNKNLEQAVEKAAGYRGKPVTVKLFPGIYKLDRSESVQKLYYISNTTSESDDPDPTKHIGLSLNSLKNVTIDGCGSTLLMGGEMTSVVFDNCENVVLKNVNIDYQAPTQVEMTVTEDGDDYMIVKVHPTSQYKIENGVLTWYGDGWSFTNGIAQIFDPETDKTWRSWSPTENLLRAVELRPNVLYLQYKNKPRNKVNWTFQIRDSFRDEVCGFVYKSRNIRFENVNFYYLGNFGVVCQTSETVTFERCNFGPRPGSRRTNAGFADFIQVSGCRGLVTVDNSRFVGAHDDPINVHGTHLKVIEVLADDCLKLRYMHDQTFGFESFFKGDEVELVDPNTLVAVAKARVKDSKLLSPREVELRLTRPLSAETLKRTGLVVENVTWTPEVRITNNYFERIPTRGILITTRRKSLIEGNTFYGMQMSGVFVADDGKSWYESGPVYDLTIRRNTFLDCGEPVISIDPENGDNKEPVHKNITIEENSFYMREGCVSAIRAKAVDGLVVRNNFIHLTGAGDKKITDCIQTHNCEHVTITGNSF